MAEPVRLILDTDVGDDVDDAFAIAQAALHPGIELVAVTTCYGDTGFRARLATVVLESLGAGATLVGTPDMIAAALKEYVEAGVEAFILSGWPHVEEAERFGRDIMPLLKDTDPTTLEEPAPVLAS